MTTDQLQYFPPASRPYCLELWQSYPFKFVLRKDRTTKLGDYRHGGAIKTPTITVNRGLSPESFLITYIHEVAHHVAITAHGKKIRPHGKEWKQTFRRLMAPVMSTDNFQPALLNQLSVHMLNPKASMGADHKLWLALNPDDNRAEDIILLDIPDETTFIYRKRLFKKLNKRRTRVLCQELTSKRQYLIPGIATIQLPD
jgi:SprT protein